jgi:hypothetical protein
MATATMTSNPDCKAGTIGNSEGEVILDWRIRTAGEWPVTSNLGQPLGDFQCTTYYEQMRLMFEGGKASTNEGQARCACQVVGVVCHRMGRTFEGPMVTVSDDGRMGGGVRDQLYSTSVVMCWAGLGSKARAWAGLLWAWAYGDAEPSPVGGLGLGWAWLGLGPGLAI